MEVLTRTNGREMTLAISGELDHHGAHGAMQQIDHALDAALPLSLTMDLSRVSFMDSSGIAVVLRAHRRMAALGGSLGEWLGMVSLHHKTKHKKFLILVPAFLFIHIALGAWLLFFRG